ncbi:MAG: NAD(P)-dependent oxidoreductase [Actinomycetota bacterium]
MNTDCAGARLDREQLLLTGAGGMTGQVICASAADSLAVHAVSRRPRPAGLPASVCWHRADLSTPDFVADLPRRIDHVVHLAQSPRFREFPEGAPDVFAVNVAAAALLLQWAVGAQARHFVLASTGSVYSPSAGRLRETDQVTLGGVAGFYAASKMAAELIAAGYASIFSVVTIRPFYLYGRGQDSSMLIPKLVQSIRAGSTVKLTGEDGFLFTPTFVSDAAYAVLAALKLADSRVVNIGGPEVLSLRTACEIIGAAVGRSPVFERVDGKVQNLVPDLELMRSLLVAPAVRFDAGVRQLISAAEEPAGEPASRDAISS